ncbi:MAG: Ku protein, partial [Mycobacterium sp.]|nr:Ku protein [Mycobacterium sp.]
DQEVEVRAPELKMAGQVVASMAADFQPDQFTDTYQEQLRELVAAKLAGGEAFTPAQAPAMLDDSEDVSDLLAKLEASVRRRREQSAATPPADQAPADGAPADPESPATRSAKKSPSKKTPAKKTPTKKAPAQRATVKK